MFTLFIALMVCFLFLGSLLRNCVSLLSSIMIPIYMIGSLLDMIIFLGFSFPQIHFIKIFGGFPMILNDYESEYALQLFSLRYSQLLDEISGLGSRAVPRSLLTEFHVCRGLRAKLINWKRSRIDV